MTCVPKKSQSELSFLDINRYDGCWYEAGKYDNVPYGQGCNCVKAEYKYDSMNKLIHVTNTCYKDNVPLLIATGRAYPTNKPGYLLITFDNYKSTNPLFQVPPWNNSISIYIVLWTDYDNYSFVGTVDKCMFWILSRKKCICHDDYKSLYYKTKQLGYNPDKVLINF